MDCQKIFLAHAPLNRRCLNPLTSDTDITFRNMGDALVATAGIDRSADGKARMACEHGRFALHSARGSPKQPKNVRTMQWSREL
jgi:hypothetical protein